MHVRCKNCLEKLAVDDAFSGREVRCPKCEYTFVAEPIETDDKGPQESTDSAGNDASAEDPATIPPAAPQTSPGADSTAANEQSSPSQQAAVGQVQETSSTTPAPTVTTHSEQTTAADPPTRDPGPWYLKIPEGYEFGPVELARLDQWVTEGRVADDCWLRTEGSERWERAAQHYPVLDESGNPFSTRKTAVISGGHILPHRGGTVLGLSILGCVIPFVSIWPAVIGTRDLRLMSMGKMDAGGDAITRSGQAIAMVSSIIWFGAFAIALLALLAKMMDP